jgi:EmrB/QacA subfamily drug resistance transporter
MHELARGLQPPVVGMTIRSPCDEAVVRSGPEATDCGPATGRWVLAAAVLGSSITFIDGTVVNVALPVLQRAFGASVAQAQWIVQSSALMLAALILVGGSLGDRLGHRRVFSTGVLVFALASVWCGLASNLGQLIVARAVQGIGAALLVPGSLALISANFSKERRGPAIGTWSGFTAIAVGVGPILGGWLVEQFSWRWIFFMSLPLAAAGLLIVWQHVPDSRDDQMQGPLDWGGATLATLGLGAIVFSLIESSTRGLTAPLVIASFTLGVAALVAFVFVETRHEAPMMPLRLFRSPTFAGATLVAFFLYAALGGLLFWLPFDLIQVQRCTPTAAGAALVPFVLTMFLLSRWAGSLIERYGSKPPLVVGSVIAAAGAALFAMPGTEAGNYWTSFFPAVMVMSIGITTSVAPLTTTVMGAVAERRAGIASGINNAVSRIASLLAVALTGVLMLNTFHSSLADRLRTMPIPAQAREQLLQRSADLVNLEIPDGIRSETQAAIRQGIRESFVAGFRLIAYVSAALAAASAVAAWLLIAGKPRVETDARPT